jgi:fructose-1,6-bisphosphatase I
MNYPLTLTQYLLKHLADHPDQAELTMIMGDLATIGKCISRETNRAGVAGILGEVGYTNVQNEQVKKLDVLANELCKEYLRQTGHFAALASEEEDATVLLNDNAKYIIAFDPLDGSGNIDINASIGTIFSVHKRLENVPVDSEQQFLQRGRDQVLAGYIFYGASTVLVFSFGAGVHEFTLDQSIGEFLLSRERIMIPDECEFYSVNETNVPNMRQKEQQFVRHLRDEKKCSLRYFACLVADGHRGLLKGGIFLYPGVDKKGAGAYEGKLRLNYEVKPMAFLYEQAGGLATNGEKHILDMIPTSLHQRVPLIMGNRDIVEKYLQS